MIIAGKSPPAVSSPTLFDSLTVRSSAVSCRRLAVGETDDHYFVRKSLKHWDKFYERHQHKFFKDRHYLEKDWGHYFADSEDCAASANGKALLEIGCGAGNTIFPLIAAYPNLFVHACDFSQLAIDLVKSHPKFCADWINVFVCDVASQELCDYIQPSSVDVVTLIFMLSAVSPDKMPFVLQNLKKVLKPNGQILLRDYAVGDYAQVKLENKSQIISDNFCFRGDGTCSFYFSEEFLSALFAEAGFNSVEMNTYCRQMENRSRNMKFQRFSPTSSFFLLGNLLKYEECFFNVGEINQNKDKEITEKDLPKFTRITFSIEC